MSKRLEVELGVFIKEFGAKESTIGVDQTYLEYLEGIEIEKEDIPVDVYKRLSTKCNILELNYESSIPPGVENYKGEPLSWTLSDLLGEIDVVLKEDTNLDSTKRVIPYLEGYIYSGHGISGWFKFLD